jgi:hypothetical protein
MGIYGEKSASDVKTAVLSQYHTTSTTKANAKARMIRSLTVNNVVGERQYKSQIIDVFSSCVMVFYAISRRHTSNCIYDDFQGCVCVGTGG